MAGQAYTEYGLILVLVGITVIGALTAMRQQVGGMWHGRVGAFMNGRLAPARSFIA